MRGIFYTFLYLKYQIEYYPKLSSVVDIGESLPQERIVGGLKYVIVKQGKKNEFESLFRELAWKVREHDKGCNYYVLYKSEQARTYIVME